MDVEKHRRQALLSWLFVVVLVTLCATLGILQYRWIGEASRAEGDRMRAGLETRLQRLSRDFNAEIAAACSALTPGERESESHVEADYAARYLAWKNSGRYPGLFRRISLVVPEGDQLLLKNLDLNQGTFAPVEWPLEWNSMRERISGRLRGGDGAPILRVNESDLIDLPHFGRPRERGDFRGSMRGREMDWLLAELDLDYVRAVLLPDLLQRNIGPDYQVEVIARESSSTVIYRSSGEAAPIGAHADASVGLFSIDQFRFRGGAARGGGRGGGRGRGGPPPDFPSSPGRWLLSVRHNAGSLGAVVDRARWRNLAVTSAVLLLMLATIAALVRFTRRAQRLAELQMEFVAGVSHELRTPLTVIRTAAHNLGERLVSNENQIQRYGALIRTEAEKLTGIVEQVLLFSNVRAGRAIRAREVVAMDSLIENTMAASARVVEGCAVELSIEPGLPPVVGDPAALQHALQNLLGNAAKYGGEGGWIGVSASASGDAAKPSIQIRVADRGPGIPREELSHVFDSFYRGRRAIEDHIHGTGLGLSLVKRIVEAHGGTVSVRSEPGKGTEFVMRIPALAASEIDEFSDSTHRG